MINKYFFFFLFIPGIIFAQETKVLVVDANTSDPIENVKIETNTKEDFYTNINGEILISDDISEITVTKDGYVSVTKLLNENSQIVIKLETEIFNSDVESSIISLSDFDLSDDSNTSDFASGLLSSYNDVFQG